jgi:hypothetical protein
MTEACCGETGGQAIHRTAGPFRAIDALALAASPTFAIMALLTGTFGSDPVETLCSAAHTSPLSGMVMMYVLMSTFYVGQWLKLIRGGWVFGLTVRAKVRYEEQL